VPELEDILVPDSANAAKAGMLPCEKAEAQALVVDPHGVLGDGAHPDADQTIEDAPAQPGRHAPRRGLRGVGLRSLLRLTGGVKRLLHHVLHSLLKLHIAVKRLLCSAREALPKCLFLGRRTDDAE
jgi:hypothetical protein